MGLPYGEEIMIVDRTMWTQCTSVTDGESDRRTDRITITKTVQRIASHGKKVKERIAVNGFPSHSYGTSLAIWDHTVLPVTRPK